MEKNTCTHTQTQRVTVAYVAKGSYKKFTTSYAYISLARSTIFPSAVYYVRNLFLCNFPRLILQTNRTDSHFLSMFEPSFSVSAMFHIFDSISLHKLNKYVSERFSAEF